MVPLRIDIFKLLMETIYDQNIELQARHQTSSSSGTNSYAYN